MSTERKASSTITAYAPETHGVDANSQLTADNESYRDGGDIQTRGPSNDAGTRKDHDDPDRDGGDIQTRGSDNHIPTRKDNNDPDRDGGDIQSRGSDGQTNSSSLSQDDVERGA